MHYAVSDGHGLQIDPFKALVAPRPIAWISTVEADGRPNLAPYSFFNAIGTNPPMVMFSSEDEKDTVRLAASTSEFVVNLVSKSHAEQMNATSLEAPGSLEFEIAGVTPVPSHRVRPPRVAGVPAALECRVVDVWRPQGFADGLGPHVVIGAVVAVFIDDAYLVNGRFDTRAAALIGRLGYRDYCVVSDTFQLQRPTRPAAP